ncbi:MAG TPA: MarR family transcriptional regulator [Ktedonobacterales bacterium]|jgi:DNA-binding MarR family transcriptional regulator|nr:MarR family transcriptional regulator [Ktedonobacterales bacterium]
MNEHATLHLVPALERATHAVALWIERAFADLRLTQAEAHVLAALSEIAPCSINDLHHRFGHKRSTLTSLLDRLEERGWVRRGTHPASRRLVLVELTEDGRLVAERVQSTVQELEARLMSQLDSADIAAFARVLSALEEELR